MNSTQVFNAGERLPERDSRPVAMQQPGGRSVMVKGKTPGGWLPVFYLHERDVWITTHGDEVTVAGWCYLYQPTPVEDPVPGTDPGSFITDVTNIGAYGKNCEGCKQTGRDVMIDISHGEDGITRVFLTRAQAEHLSRMLTNCLETNERPGND